MAETRLQTQASLGVQLLGPDLRRLLGPCLRRNAIHPIAPFEPFVEGEPTAFDREVGMQVNS
jgi:hypothetical protein